jgi:hypothetical protein
MCITDEPRTYPPLIRNGTILWSEVGEYSQEKASRLIEAIKENR